MVIWAVMFGMLCFVCYVWYVMFCMIRIIVQSLFSRLSILDYQNPYVSMLVHNVRKIFDTKTSACLASTIESIQIKRFSFIYT